MNNRLNYLFEKFISNTCTADELDELIAHFNESDPDQLRYLILNQLELSDDHSKPKTWEAERMELIHARIIENIKPEPKISKRVLWQVAAAAAVVLLTIGISLTIFLNRQNPPQQIASKPSLVQPGKNQATLTLANGKQIILTNQLRGLLAKQGNSMIMVNGQSGISYSVNKNGTKTAAVYNTLSTARGEQSPFPLLLPDGSRVWLNAASSITYPTSFTGNSRIVKMTGEAYFEVAHNAAKPFHVVFNGQDLKVLGTHFNVNAYPDEDDNKTTLLQGAITLTNIKNHQTVSLSPGQQALASKGAAHFTLSTVNTNQVISWKNGFFQFDNMSITTIMKALSRWYDIDVHYDRVDLNETFGGTFSRNANINDILKSISAVGKVRFELSGRTVSVKNK